MTFTNFYVRIKVQPPGPQTVDLHTIAAEDGHVLSSGQVLGPPNVGDSPENAGGEAFLSFDISGIPSNATITKVVTDFRDYDTVGDPFVLGNDGCVRAYVQDFGTLDAADFFNGDPTELSRTVVLDSRTGRGGRTGRHEGGVAGQARRLAFPDSHSVPAAAHQQRRRRRCDSTG